MQAITRAGTHGSYESTPVNDYKDTPSIGSDDVGNAEQALMPNANVTVSMKNKAEGLIEGDTFEARQQSKIQQGESTPSGVVKVTDVAGVEDYV